MSSQESLDNKEVLELAEKQHANSNIKLGKNLIIKSAHILEIKEYLGNIIGHTIIISFVLLSIYLVHALLDRLLGKDAVLIDLFKVKYIIDAGDLMVLLSWLLVVILNSYKIVWKTLKEK